ncbi:MAG TPA: pyruvate kinase [Flavobacteriaceae bacterium]|jgi:pyruvate kinase|nr:pyruvate kinase [Flavobacteriaceae bacterium]HCZ09698.1 pyruvate kinase [Flavobacteriaceae bacterium]|tara:strand:+ start:4175 stop:5602 length:1428 start_codon:yes stop_codon:yes gene_type:complete
MTIRKKTKIIATLGPASDKEEIIEEMILSGVDVFRINFSHAEHEDVKKRIQSIRKISKKLNSNTSILADLQGPKLRIGKVEADTTVAPGDQIAFLNGDPFEGNKEKVFMNYENFSRDVKPGERILLDDGKLIFEVIATDKQSRVDAKVIQGGKLKSKKGVNLPNTKISLPALTKKDIVDAEFAIGEEVDWIALSFVRNSEDILDLRKMIEKQSDHKIPIIAKIEKPEGIENIDKIISYCDGLMVARGDLGVEIPPAEVPLVQKELVKLAKKARIPVIIATQMMESMIDSLTATRAEVNDVANSVMDGADAVMLSGETSVGEYPVEVIKSMSSIILSVENSELISVPQKPPNIRTVRFITKSICYHAVHIANDVQAKAICTLTNSGYTAFQVSAWRPHSFILVFTSNKRILTQLNLIWGVKAFFYDSFESTDKTVEQINDIASKMEYVKKGDLLVNLTAMPIVEKGMVNTLRVSTV